MDVEVTKGKSCVRQNYYDITLQFTLKRPELKNRLLLCKISLQGNHPERLSTDSPTTVGTSVEVDTPPSRRHVGKDGSFVVVDLWSRGGVFLGSRRQETEEAEVTTFSGSSKAYSL